MITYRFNPNVSSLILEVRLEYVYERTRKMLFDTGASLTVITPRVAEELGYDLSQLKTASLYTASREESVYQLNLRSISMESGKILNISALCMPLPSELKIDGLLGLNFLRHFNINLNFEEGILTFIPLEKYFVRN
ncbi:MAG: hypothetical protein COS84_02630 [Armatimonadetes bacterium CG07_land_8_20_14_0_80_40_9]|nr:MAG: hypothetical protein COS84_02630 [Armatimonadetes bacterium CG07_land_8_20_14_0_80_40_9]